MRLLWKNQAETGETGGSVCVSLDVLAGNFVNKDSLADDDEAA